MIICSSCKVANVEGASLCRNCGRALEPLNVARRYGLPSYNAFLFVLDCAASMAPVVAYLKDFAAELAGPTWAHGVADRVGAVVFRDEADSVRALDFDSDGALAASPARFRRTAAEISPSGGLPGRRTPNSLPAVRLGASLLGTHADGAGVNRVLVLVTNAPPAAATPAKAQQELRQTAAALDEHNIQYLYLLINTDDPASLEYTQLIEGRQGLAFRIFSGGAALPREHIEATLGALKRGLPSTIRR